MLEGKVALVTGASSGIGEATAEALAEQGAAVVLAARRVDRLEKLHNRLVERGFQSLPVELDVTDEDAVNAAVARAVEHFGHLDIVINNAGVMLLGKIVGADTTDWTRMVNTNLLGSMFVAHATIPHLLASKGALVQVSSVAGRIVRLGSGGYNATKWGINAFTEALRMEVTAQGVRVIVIEPGAVDTELADHITDPEARAGVTERLASVTRLTSDDIAKAVVYAVTQPDYVAVNEILIRPTNQVG